MAYYLRQDKKKKGIYLQMYETYWNKENVIFLRINSRRPQNSLMRRHPVGTA